MYCINNNNNKYHQTHPNETYDCLRLISIYYPDIAFQDMHTHAHVHTHTVVSLPVCIIPLPVLFVKSIIAASEISNATCYRLEHHNSSFNKLEPDTKLLTYRGLCKYISALIDTKQQINMWIRIVQDFWISPRPARRKRHKNRSSKLQIQQQSDISRSSRRT